MNPNVSFFDQFQVCAGFIPVDMSTAANSGDWLNMENYESVVFLLYKAAGTAGDDPTLTIQQATDASGTGAKALTFTDIYVKQGTLTSVGQYTRTTQAAANTYTDATSAEIAAIWGVQVRAEDLDIENAFTFVQGSVADVGVNAQLGALLCIGINARYGLGDNLPSMLA